MAGQPRILIVDDQAGILKMVGHMFHEEGFEVHVADNGEKGLQKVNEVQPDLVLLDVMMPGMSGIEVCRQLRTNPNTARIPIIMLSAMSQVPDKLEGFNAGADDYVTKPVARAELLARSRALLARASFSQTPVAQVVAFVGAKGGVGTTTLAINTAVSLIRQNHSVTLIEMRDTPGTAVFQLNLNPEQDLGKLLAFAPEDLNSRNINRTVIPHQTGLKLLAAPRQPTDIALTTEHIEIIIDTLARQSAYLFLDLPSISGKSNQEALDRADQIILVTEPEILSVKAAAQSLTAIKSWSLLDRTSVAVVSRSPSAMLMRQEEIERALNIPPETILTIVPPSTEAFQQASRVGKPVITIKPDSLPSKAIVKVAQRLTEQKGIPVISPA